MAVSDMGTLDSSVGINPTGGRLINSPSDGRVLTSTGQTFLVGQGKRCVTRIVSKPDREGKASAQKNGLLYETLQRQYTRQYLVYTNNAMVGPSQILQTIGVPFVGGAYPYALYGDEPDVLATCVNVDIKSTNHPCIWSITAEFDTDRLVSQFSDNPLQQPPDVTWDSQVYEFPMRYDTYGVACVSSSGNQFDPPAMVERTRTVYRVTRNEAYAGPQVGNVPPVAVEGFRTFDPIAMDAYRRMLNISNKRYALNLDTGKFELVEEIKFMGRDDLTARINFINGHRMMTNGILHIQATYEVEFRTFPDTFIEYYLDQDYRDPAGNIFRDPRDQMPFQNQSPMNGRGQPIFLATPRPPLASITKNLGTISATQTTVTLSPAGYPGGLTYLAFPPKPKLPNADGIIIGPDYYFYIRIDDEVMLVTGGADSLVFTVVRGQKGTVPVVHSNNTNIVLEPYFLRFIPTGVIDFSPLGLDQI